jgi:transcriptional regulator with XRE-family HTH domain
MAAKNKLTQAPPYAVEQALKQLGANLRTARIRRNMTIQDAAERIGTGPRAVMDAERGKPSTFVAVHTALLWLYNLLGPLQELADPARDTEGMSLEARKQRTRARKGRGLDNEF